MESLRLCRGCLFEAQVEGGYSSGVSTFFPTLSPILEEEPLKAIDSNWEGKTLGAGLLNEVGGSDSPCNLSNFPLFNISEVSEGFHQNAYYVGKPQEEHSNLQLDSSEETIEQIESFLEEYVEGTEFRGFSTCKQDLNNLRKQVLHRECLQARSVMNSPEARHTRSKGHVMDLPHVQEETIERRRIKRK